MADNLSEISKWIPVIGTLCGAMLGFLASFVTALFNQKNLEKVNKENRERQRLEEIYRALIDTKRYLSELVGEAIHRVKFNQEIKKELREGKMPPLVRLDMLISLYTPSLKDVHSEFQKAAQEFGAQHLRIITRDFGYVSSPDKDALLKKVLALYEDADSKRDVILQKIPSLIKP